MIPIVFLLIEPFSDPSRRAWRHSSPVCVYKRTREKVTEGGGGGQSVSAEFSLRETSCGTSHRGTDDDGGNKIKLVLSCAIKKNPPEVNFSSGAHFKKAVVNRQIRPSSKCPETEYL